ncbi:MAG: cell division protein ZapA [bacterium]|nr:cell division protein ZapA [bacterium]
MEKDSPTTVRIKIMGIEYPVVGYDNALYLQEVAVLVDQRMQQLSKQQSDISPLKNAILTALNLADELIRTRQQLSGYQDEAAQYSREITQRTRKLMEICSNL